MVDAMTSAMGRDLLALDDLTSSDLLAILKRAQDFAGCWSQRRMPQSLSGKRIALIVDDGGWRNTTAFDLGVNSMGGLCVHTPLRLGHREAVADLANYLDNWIDEHGCAAESAAAPREETLEKHGQGSGAGSATVSMGRRGYSHEPMTWRDSRP
jgi:ornithine carbamoyltransferase